MREANSLRFTRGPDVLHWARVPGTNELLALRPQGPQNPAAPRP